MYSKLSLLLFMIAVCSRNFYISAKPCWSGVWGDWADWTEYFEDDSEEDDPNMTKPSQPQNLTIFLTPTVDANRFQQLVAAAKPGQIYLLPSLIPAQHGESSTSTTTTTTTTTTAAPAAAAPTPAAGAAPAGNGTAAGAPAAGAPAAAAPAAG